MQLNIRLLQSNICEGGKVYLACRSLERGRRAAEEIKKETEADDSRVPVMHLDLSSFQSVRKFVTEFKQSE